MLTTLKDLLAKKAIFKKNALLLLVVLCSAYSVSAQAPAKPPVTTPATVPAQAAATTPVAEKPLVAEKILLNDAKEIRYKAKTSIDLLARLFNYIAFPDNPQSAIDEAIANSYTPTARNFIFDSKDFVVDDDTDPEASLTNKTEVPVSKYLNDLDVQYVKTGDASIFFTNYVYSNIKKKDYVYVKIRFDAKFTSTNKIKKIGYPVRQREAMVKMLPAGNGKWKATIVALNFYNPANPIDATDNDMQVAVDTSANSSLVSQNDIEAAVRKQEEEQAKIAAQNEARADQYLKEGKNYTAAEQYDQALTMFTSAKELRPLDPSLDKLITDTKRSIAENTFDNYKGKGDQAYAERRFEEANKFYQKAGNLDPKRSPELTAQKTAIQKKLKDIYNIQNLIKSGQYEAAKNECARILGLKENKAQDRKNDLPEIYYLQARAYQGMYELKTSDTRSRDRAIENYDIAINIFPAYVDAHIARANFLVKSLADYTRAFTDYDALIGNALDINPQKPVYYVQKARWEDMANRGDAALEDYAQAIKLNDKVDTFYYSRGELLSRLTKYDEAQADLSKTLELNPKFRLAWYNRGLNYVTLKDNYKAGLDFIDLEKLGMTPDQQANIDSISSKFFYQGQAALAAHDFPNADSAYNNALKIRNCNAKAFHGKAEIRLITGDEQTAKQQPALAKQSYQESIDLNRKAIKCNPGFSDAHFKEGLAHRDINENDLAITSFSAAINADNTNVQAYIERGNTLQVQKKYASAPSDYNGALALLKANYDAAKNSSDKNLIKGQQSNTYQLLGAANYYARVYADALIALNQSLDLNGDNAEALYYRGLVYYATNELSKSISDLDHAIKSQPQYKYYYADGNSNFKYKKYDVAITHYTNVITMDTANVIKNKTYLRGLCYFDKKDKMLREALADFEEYGKTDVSKTDTNYFADYGQAQLFANQDSAAFKNLNYALKLAPNNSKALYGLACYYAKNNQFDKVLDLVERSFKTMEIKRDDIRPEEDAFLVEFNKDKTRRNNYKTLRQTYQVDK